MYNVLLSSTNIEYIKQLISKLSHNIENIKITNITTNEEETISTIMSGKVDIIIIDNDKNNLNILNVLKGLYNSFLFPFPILIVIASNVEELRNSEQYDAISSIIPKSYDNQAIIKTIKDITMKLEEKNNKSFYEKKVQKELSSLGFNPMHNGTKYIICATILIKFCRNEELTSNFEKYLYLEVAKRYNTTVYNVKTNISKAIKYAYAHINSQVLSNYFRIRDNSKATAKLVITIMAYNI